MYSYENKISNWFFSLPSCLLDTFILLLPTIAMILSIKGENYFIGLRLKYDYK